MFHSTSDMMTLVLRVPRSYIYSGFQLTISAVGKNYFLCTFGTFCNACGRKSSTILPAVVRFNLFVSRFYERRFNRLFLKQISAPDLGIATRAGCLETCLEARFRVSRSRLGLAMPMSRLGIGP